MASKDIHLVLTAHLLEQIDLAAKSRHASRSDYIRQAIVLRLNRESIIKNQSTSASSERWDDDKWQALIDEANDSLDESNSSMV